MDEFKLIYVFLLFGSTITQSFVTISTTHSRFKIHHSGRVTQRIYTSQQPNGSVEYEADLENMRLLRDTRILAHNRRSCVVNAQNAAGSGKPRSHGNVSMSTKRVIFHEVAKVTRYYSVTRA
jgi:hypothetical protein